MATYAAKGDRFEKNTINPTAMKAVTKVNPNSYTGLSEFWNDCPLNAIMTDPGAGYMMSDGFEDLGLAGTITTIISDAGVGRYLAFGSAGATITPDAALGGGVVITEATDNESISITTKQTPFQITSGAGSLWFECRIKTSTITTAEQAWLVGLMDATAQTATVPITATGTIADINMVGFHHQEANTTAFDTTYKANTVTAVEVNSDVGTLVAGTYVKLGMKFDTRNNLLSFYIDGVKQAGTKTIPNATGTDFPADVLLAPVIAMTLANSAEETITMDWWKCVQAR
jgi:hypothetical protein